MDILYQDPRVYRGHNSYKFCIATSLSVDYFDYHVRQNPELYLIREM